ncbi:MAG: DNA/RNA non-specific endonuclease [Eubacterium sp.]|nr:DNA/RNA non-specific endonuclease [Eubacterium sp.]
MGALSIDSFEQESFTKVKYDVTDKLDSLNKFFKSRVESVEGKFGKAEQAMGDAISKNINFNEVGNAIKEYKLDDKIIKTVENIGDGIIKTTSFDDRGTAYLEETTKLVEGNYKTEIKLKPNIEIIKDNVTTKTDNLGRVVSSKIENIKLKPVNSRDNAELNTLKVNEELYEGGYQKGHIIPDRFGGTATHENITPEYGKLNQGVIKRTENFAAKLCEEGHKVTYEKNPNYVGKSEIPSSYDIKITVDEIDSKEFIKNNPTYEKYADLPDKIYNSEEYYNGEMNTAQKLVTDFKETGTKIGVKAKPHHEAGMEAAAIAATVTCAISTVDNVTACIGGEITADQAAINIAKDTGTAGAVGYGVGFISSAVSSSMASSSNALISSLGNSCVPAAAVSFGIASYDTVVNYAKGEITTEEFAYDMGENAVGVAGSIGGAALAGAAVGSVVPGAGTVVGAAAGVVGGMVGYAVTTGAYKTTVEAAGDAIEEYSDEIKKLGEKAQSIADDTLAKATMIGENAVSDVKDAISKFNLQNKLPW